MKKLVALLLVAMMLCASMAALAETPEGYPEVVPGIDLGGQKLFIYDYWSSSSNDRKAEPTEEEQAQYDYRDWIMATYNVQIEQVAKGDWGSNATELVNFKDAPDGTLALFILPPDFVGGPLANGYLAAWNHNDLVDLNDTEKWNAAMVDFMTLGDSIYGVSTGALEPRGCLYFNKRVLEEAGIDWHTIYDMQQEGTWTWAAFEEMCAKIQKDTDNDGITDIWAMTGSNVDLYRVAVYNNGGSFFGKTDDGKLTITANSDNTLEALDWCKHMWETYAFQGIPDENGSVQWDYYKDAWKQGFCGFYVYQTYGGFNDNSEMADMADEWGCVAIPAGPSGNGTLLHVASENVTVIPACYDDDTIAKMAFIYSLWSDATPGYDDEDSWIQNKFDYTDDRAVLETYAMLRDAAHAVLDPVLYLGSVNDVEGQDYLWELMNKTPQEMYETKLPSWEGLVNAFNANK